MAVPISGNTSAGVKGTTEEDALLSPSPTPVLSPTSSIPWSLSTSSAFTGPPSPFLEPVGGVMGVTDISAHLGSSVGGYQHGLIKIGQTGLHNPGGRSSWIGL
jgi:protein arginine N-methyltransferase 5